jgi:hypothetical protein
MIHHGGTETRSKRYPQSSLTPLYSIGSGTSRLDVVVEDTPVSLCLRGEYV